MALLILVLFNPAILLYVAHGQNEAISFAWLVLLLFLLRKQWLNVALLTLGIACGIKQTIGFMIPFTLVYVYQKQRPDRWFPWPARSLGLVIAPLILSLLPFAIWDLGALIEDMVEYLYGGDASGFPIMGFGVGQLLLDIGVIPGPRGTFPFWALQLIAGVPVLWLLLRWQWHSPALAGCARAYGVFILLLYFLSRYFHDTHLVFGITLVAVSYLLGEQQEVSG